MAEDRTPHVREARRDDIGQVARVLSRAFFDDPMFSWMFPDPERRLTQSARLFAIELAYDYLPSGRVEVAEVNATIRGAATWQVPGHGGGLLSLLRGAPHMVGLFGRRTPEIARGLSVVAKAAPKGAFHLHEIGTDPIFRGHGLGAALLRSGLGRADAEGAPAYLESSTEANIAVYERFGFAATGQISGRKMPVMYPMWREPRS